MFKIGVILLFLVYCNTKSVSFLSILAGYGNFTVSLSMYNDSSFTTKHTSFPASVKLDQRVYFEVQTGSNDSDIVVLIEKCSSSPTTSKYHPLSYDLVKNR